MGKVHFFCELGELTNQNIGDEFGPQSTTLYNLTSRHTLSSVSKAFAMFDGEVRYQEDQVSTSNAAPSTSLLNAVLKVRQSKLFQGIPVKYVIYRGIRKDSLLDSSNKFVTGFSNDHVIHAKLNTQSPTNTGDPEDPINTNNYLELGLGIENNSSAVSPHVHLADSEDLDRLFYNDTGEGFAPIGVTCGDELGNFDTCIGIDIILEGSWQKPTLSSVRNIDVLTGVQISNPANKGEKEQVLQYMDVTSLIGSFYRQRIKNESGSDKKDNIYTNVLTKFVNKNRVYLDIRNDNNLSLNYYNNYSAGIQLANTNSGSLDQVTYHTSDWPIFIFDSGSDYIETISNERKTRIKLQIDQGDNTLNLCFLKHAPLYKKENFELWNRFPKYQVENSRFIELHETPGTQTPQFSKPLELSTYQTQNDEVVAFYIRLFYAKQKEAQQTGSGNVKATSDNPLDNLFNLNELSKIVSLLSRTDSNSNNYYRSIFDGNEKYIHATSNDSSKKHTDILYSGMYKTGIAIDSANIYFFAIPYAFNENIKKPNIKIPIGSFDDSKGFLKLLAAQSNAVSDLSIKKVEITQSPANLFLLNLNSTPSKDSKIKSYDSETFICICMERSEYQSHVDTALDSSIANPFQHNLHPEFLQVIRQDFEPKGTDANDSSISHVYHLIELRVVGYKNNIIALDPLVLNFYHKSRSGRLVSSNNAALQVDVPIFEFETQIEIGHDPYTNSTEFAKYNEIAEALDLVKKHNPDVINKIENLLTFPKEDILPVIGSEVGKLKFGTKKEVRKRSLLIQYDTPTAAGANNRASTIFSDYPIQNIPGYSSSETRSPRVVFEGFYNTSNPSGINKQDYENLALNTSPGQNRSPVYIANNFKPKLYINYPFYVISSLKSPGDEESIEKYRNKGIGAFHLGADIANSKNPSIPYKSPRILINTDERDVSGQYLNNGSLPYIQMDQGNLNELFRFEDFSQRVIRLANLLAHELGHFLEVEADYLTYSAWKELQKEYPINLDETVGPINGGGGHLEGQPTGVRALKEDFEFCKSLFIKKGGLWDHAENQIKAKGFTNEVALIRDMKMVDLKPNYLAQNSNDPNQFDIRPDYKGNISQVDYPNDTLVPKL